jgi:DNA helicase II / ATP-dependent DNA helicase PcrA
MALSDQDGLAEELRLLYVACTRARDELNITFPLRFHVQRHGRDDRHHLAQLSRFLEPLGSHLDRVAAGDPVGGDPPLALDGPAVALADDVDQGLSALWE